MRLSTIRPRTQYQIKHKETASTLKGTANLDLSVPVVLLFGDISLLVHGDCSGIEGRGKERNLRFEEGGGGE